MDYISRNHTDPFSPASLYNICVNIAARKYGCFSSSFRKRVNARVLLDVHSMLTDLGYVHKVAVSWLDISVFLKIFSFKPIRHKIHPTFQYIIDSGVPIHAWLTTAFMHCRGDLSVKSYLFETLFDFATFLCDAGWFELAEKLQRRLLSLPEIRLPQFRDVLFELLTRLLRTLNGNCNYSKFCLRKIEIENTFGNNVNDSVSFLTEICLYYFALCQYDQAYDICTRIVTRLNHDLPISTISSALRASSRACTIKRKFHKAELLILEALALTKLYCGESSLAYAAALQDFGFFLLNVDNVSQAVAVYRAVLHIRTTILGRLNVLVAVARADLAYALYVHEYSNGQFHEAKSEVNEALEVLSDCLAPNHLIVATSKRVKALILEEIAVDSQDASLNDSLLREAYELHSQSLELVLRVFGENNVQTAKHYGNMGRLFQSMKMYPEAEKMHLKAMRIKEALLGCDDHEVALSIGHLASLYNYDMGLYREAEKLYFRSIAIGESLFGDTYSGLEYDYRGLIRLYQRTNRRDMAERFIQRLARYIAKRAELTETNPLSNSNDPLPFQRLEFLFFASP